MNKNTGIIVGLVVAVLVLWGGVRYFSNQSSAPVVPAETTTLPTSTTGSVVVPAPVAPKRAVTAPKPTTLRPAASVTRNVIIKGYAYSPSTITIKKGDRIIWKNMDTVAHTISGGTNGPNSSPLGQNQTYDYVFAGVGTYTYTCNFHPSMSGTVIVTN